MTISLPNDLEGRIEAAVRSGRFASVDAAMAEAARLLLREPAQTQPTGSSTNADNTAPSFIGALRDDADLLDQAVAHAMKVREERPWRLPASE